MLHLLLVSNVWISGSLLLYLFLVPFLFFFWLFILYYYDLFVFVLPYYISFYFHFLGACLFANERQEWGWSRWEGRMWGSGGNRKHNQNIVYKSKSILCKIEVSKEKQMVFWLHDEVLIRLEEEWNYTICRKMCKSARHMH